jgi:hypothetical protein
MMSRNALPIVAAATLSWGVLLVATRLLLVNFSFNAWGFTLIQLLVGGASMMVLGGRGAVVWRSLASPSIWVYGGLRVISSACSSAALLYVGVMQDTLLAAMNVPIAALIIILGSRRLPPARQALVHGVIVAGIATMALALPGGLANPAVLLEAISETAVVVSTLLIERHPHNRSDDIGARCRFTGAVLMATAAMFIVVWGLSGAAGVRLGNNALAFGDLGALLADPALLVAGALVGACLRGPTMYLALYAIRLAGTQTYLAALALLPVVGVTLEAVCAALGWLPWPHLGWAEAASAALVVGGSMLLVQLRAVRSGGAG